MYQKSNLLFVVLFCLGFMACKDQQVPKTSPKTNAAKTNDVESITAEREADLNAPAKKKTILCFGNSLTAGYGLDESQAWPYLMQQRIDSLGHSYTVVNAGLSGETTAGGLNRLDWVLKQPVDIFFLELGANDMLRGLDVTITKKNLAAIIEKVRTKYPNIPIVLAGMLSPPSMGKAYEKAFNNIYPDLAMKYKATLIPFLLEDVAGKADLNLPDGKHPNKMGQKIVLENVWSAFELIL